ncbi:antitoxin VbhA family protein [Sinomonas albida]|uniref:antitoxin VbhA family protein n=1 Tax=Sinomonas albida TaxID=369942 RepID=UPI0010A8CA22|nr:antitoxin VbhA family protein [Sinomonas albida]
MGERFDVEERWPELFAQLEPARRRSVLNTLAADWHEGWVPNREDVENITDLARGAIDHDEFLRRSDAAAERHREKP